MLITDNHKSSLIAGGVSYCDKCDNIDGLNKYKQQTANNLQLYSCSRSQHVHAIRVNWLNIVTPPSLISADPSSPFNRVTSNNHSPK